MRKELRSLPRYGVFDLLTFQVNPDASVTLGGYVLSEALNSDAEKAVAKVDGVTRVENRIEVAPVNLRDDEIRRQVFHAIYRDPFLARYGTAADEAAASRAMFRPWGGGFRNFREFRVPRWSGPPFFGWEPIGDYAIHILVKNGEVTLAGEVDSDADKEAAERAVKLLPGVVTLYNNLHVTPKS